MKVVALIILALFGSVLSAQELSVTGDARLIADFSSDGESQNVKGEYLGKYQALISCIEGTKTVKCLVRIGTTVNVIGVWEMNDLNSVQIKVYEVAHPIGPSDILLLSFMDKKALSLNLFRLRGEELTDLGYNYLEQQIAGDSMRIHVSGSQVRVSYDNDSEQPLYGVQDGKFTELDQ